MEEITDSQMQVKKVPAFTVLKNGSILKNIFLLHKQSPADNPSQNHQPDEEILLVGRHPDCNITLEHPSISRYHLRIHSNPSSHKLSVVDLSSVHGTWVSGKRIEPGVHAILKEGDTVKIGGSTRVYELHWVPLSQAYGIDGQFVPTVYTIKEEDESNQEDKHESCSSDDNSEHLDLTLSNKIHDSPLKTFNFNPLTSSMPSYFSSGADVEPTSPLRTCNENDSIISTVSIQAPIMVSETTSATTKVSESLTNTEDQLNGMRDSLCNEFELLYRRIIEENCSKTSCDDTEEEEYSSKSKTGNENGEFVNTVSNETPLVSEAVSETEISDCLNKSEDQLNLLKDNLSSEFDLISHGAIKDDSVSLEFSNNAIETHEEDKSVDQELVTKESVFVLPDVTDTEQQETSTPQMSESKEIHMNLQSLHNVSASDGKEFEFYTPDKENRNPNACSGKSLSKNAANLTANGDEYIFGYSQRLFATVEEEMSPEHNVDDLFVHCEEEKESNSKEMTIERSCNSINYPQTVQKAVNSSQVKWTMVVDTTSLLDYKSLKHLKLLEGIKGTRLFVPEFVIRELMEIKRQDNFFRINSNKVSSVLKWIDECMMNRRWWIHVDNEIAAHSLTAAPEVLEIALRLRKEVTDQKIIILSNNLTLKIKAMAEGIMCEEAEEFRRSLVNPFSERFMWVGSSARGLTWSCVDDYDEFVKQKYHGSGLNGSHRFKGLKLLSCVTTSQVVN